MDHCILAQRVSYPQLYHTYLDTLKLFLQTIAGGNMEEQTSPIGQALIQCMRAKDVPPALHIDLVIKIHHHFGSRLLLDSLHEHQFCSSYKEVQK